MTSSNPSDRPVKDSGERQVYPSGAKRDQQEGKGRFDLASPLIEARKAAVSEKGATKYDDHNWEQGFPYSRFIDSALRHLNQWRLGDTGEDHLAQFAWNVDALLHTEEAVLRGLLPAELNDLPDYRLPDIHERLNAATLAAIGPSISKRLERMANLQARTFFSPPGVETDHMPENDYDPGPAHRRLRIYVAGPLTSVTPRQRELNRLMASYVGYRLMLRGHDPYVPHNATADYHKLIGYEEFLERDLAQLSQMDALYFCASSPGADREFTEARRLGLPVFSRIADVSDLQCSATFKPFLEFVENAARNLSTAIVPSREVSSCFVSASLYYWLGVCNTPATDTRPADDLKPSDARESTACSPFRGGCAAPVG